MRCSTLRGQSLRPILSAPHKAEPGKFRKSDFQGFARAVEETLVQEERTLSSKGNELVIKPVRIEFDGERTYTLEYTLRVPGSRGDAAAMVGPVFFARALHSKGIKRVQVRAGVKEGQVLNFIEQIVTDDTTIAGGSYIDVTFDPSPPESGFFTPRPRLVKI